MVPVWIEWYDECEWLNIPVEYPIEGMNNKQDTFDEVQDHRWASVCSPLSLCPQCHSSQHMSWFHLNTCLLSVRGRMESHWICRKVLLVLRYHTRWSICTYRMSSVIEPICSGRDWFSPSIILVRLHPPICKASFDAWLHYTGCSHRDNRCLPCSTLLALCCQCLPLHVVSRSEWFLLEGSSTIA